MTTAIGEASKRSAVMVKFQYREMIHPGTFKRYTDAPTAVGGPDGGRYESTPLLKVEVPKNTGLLSAGTPKTAKISLPMDDFTDRVTSGDKCEPIYGWIYEVISPAEASSAAATTLNVYQGFLGPYRRNYKNRSGLVQLEILNLKSRLDIALSVQVEQHCLWNLGQGGCQANVVGFNATLDSVDGHIATITGLGARPDRYWQRGRVFYRDNWVTIQDWTDQAPTQFQLVRQAPSEWIGETVRVFGGCDNSIERCRRDWNQEDRFLGLGAAVPHYHPIFEQPIGGSR